MSEAQAPIDFLTAELVVNRRAEQGGARSGNAFLQEASERAVEGKQPVVHVVLRRGPQEDLAGGLPPRLDVAQAEDVEALTLVGKRRDSGHELNREASLKDAIGFVLLILARASPLPKNTVLKLEPALLPVRRHLGRKDCQVSPRLTRFPTAPTHLVHGPPVPRRRHASFCGVSADEPSASANPCFLCTKLQSTL
eukprot:scaffold2331_cov252-Pinguiococcus_pyrenoidosus.AAC.16